MGLRILFFSESAGVHVKRFLVKLATTDHQIWFLPASGVVEPDGALGNIEFLPPLQPREHVKFAGWRRGVRRLRDLLSQIRPDVVHAGPIPSCAFWAAKAGASTLLAMSWGYDLLESSHEPISRLKSRFALRHSRAVICDCETVREEVAQISGHLHGRTFVFPWGVELDRFRPQAPPFGIRARMDWEGKHMLLSTRSLKLPYGTKTLIRSALKACEQNSNLRFVFAGTGPLQAWCERTVRDHGAEGRFCFLGQVPDEQMPGLFAETDVYISGSRVDGSSISLLQAYASARPVIVTDIPANREWVAPLRNGWLVPVDDSDALARAILESAEIGNSRLVGMGKENLGIAVTRADWNKNFQTLLEAYEFVGHQSTHVSET